MLTSRTLDERCGGAVVPQVRELPAGRRVQVPRGDERAAATRRRRAARRAWSRTRRATTPRPWRWPGKLLGVPVDVVMPRTAPAVKRAATEGYGARIVPCEPTLAAREATVADRDRAARTDAGPPVRRLERDRRPGDRRLGAARPGRPARPGRLPGRRRRAALGDRPGRQGAVARDPGHRRRAGSGRRRPPLARDRRDPALERPADDRRRPAHLARRRAPSPSSRAHVDAIVTATEAEIIDAMRFVWERLKIVIEPSSAVPVAPVLTGRLAV